MKKKVGKKRAGKNSPQSKNRNEGASKEKKAERKEGANKNRQKF